MIFCLPPSYLVCIHRNVQLQQRIFSPGLIIVGTSIVRRGPALQKQPRFLTKTKKNKNRTRKSNRITSDVHFLPPAQTFFLFFFYPEISRQKKNRTISVS